jgi:hypothetical protein
MSKKHDAFPHVKLYPETVKAVHDARKRRGNPPPSFTAMANAMISIANQVEKKQYK